MKRPEIGQMNLAFIFQFCHELRVPSSFDHDPGFLQTGAYEAYDYQFAYDYLAGSRLQVALCNSTIRNL